MVTLAEKHRRIPERRKGHRRFCPPRSSAASAVETVVSLCRGGENRFYTPGSQLRSPDLRAYYLQDANWDTTAVVGFNSAAGTWGVTQRYVYSPYGSITVLNADWSTPPAGTQPVVNNLYQGMTLDAVTGLYYSPNRNYSPTLGTWISQDPFGPTGGLNLYGFDWNNPAGSVDPAGLIPTHPPGPWGPPSNSYAGYINTIQTEIKSWRSSGFDFAAALLQAFVTKRFPGGNAGMAFERFAPEIKKYPEYREDAKAYFSALAAKKGFGTWRLPARVAGQTSYAFRVAFYLDGYSNMALAFGGDSIGYKSATLVVRKACRSFLDKAFHIERYTWSVKGASMDSYDLYTFPAGHFDYRLAIPVYRAAYYLQHTYHYPTFSHQETWTDSFSGTARTSGYYYFVVM